MKKILRRGTVEIRECDFCGCKFSYDREEDIEVEKNMGKTIREYVACPQCENEIPIIAIRSVL